MFLRPNTWQKQLKQRKVFFNLTVWECSSSWWGVMVAGVRGSWSHAIHSQEAEIWTLVFSSHSPFYPVLDPSLEKAPHVFKWVFLSWLTQSRSSLTNNPSGLFPWWLLCLTNLAIKINQHTYCEHGLAGMAVANLPTLTRLVRRRNQCAVVLNLRSESLEVWILWWAIKHFISFSQNRHP